MSAMTFTYRGQVERWSASRRSYGWAEGYSTTGPEGAVRYPWLTRDECRRDARRDDCRAVFQR